MTQPSPQPAEQSVTSRARRRALATPAWLRRVRYWFALENLKEFASTLALVVPLTVLIWIWAEREQTRDDELQLTVDVRGRNPSKIISLANGDEGNATTTVPPRPVVVRISGPKVSVDAIRDAIASDRSKARVTLEVPDEAEDAGTRDVAIQPLLDQQPLFRDNGITVKSTDPETVKVRADDVTTVDVQPTLPAELAARVESIAAQPPTVKVSGARHVLDRLKREGKLQAELDLSAYPALLRDARPGTSSRPLDNVPIRPLNLPGVTLQTRTLNGVTLKFSQAQEDVLQQVVVNVTQPSGLGARVSKFEPKNLIGVRISGPPDLLRQLAIAKDDDRPYAEVRIGRADLGTSVTRIPVFRNLPDGVRVIDPKATEIHLEVDAETDVPR